MKNVISNARLFLMALGAIVVLSCSAEDGEDGVIGPQGPQGEQGLPGQDGADGQDGEDGEDGNANVIASEWFGPVGQSQESNGYTVYAEFDKALDGIDPEVFETGTVLVYARFSNFVEEVWPLGYSAILPLTISGGTTDHHFTYYFSPDNLKIRYRRDPVQEFISFSPDSRFRYVVIPAGSTSSKINPVDFTKMSYEEAMDHLGLEY